MYNLYSTTVGGDITCEIIVHLVTKYQKTKKTKEKKKTKKTIKTHAKENESPAGVFACLGSVLVTALDEVNTHK